MNQQVNQEVTKAVMYALRAIAGKKVLPACDALILAKNYGVDYEALADFVSLDRKESFLGNFQ